MAKITPGKIKQIPTDQLDFDPNNPRLVEEGIKNPTDAQIIGALADTADLGELVQSISSNGYIDIEPLIAMPVGERFRVLEGNRRLAVIRLLRNPKLASEIGISVPKAEASVAETLEKVSVYVVQSPEQAREFIGFKHINGPHKWDALAKARFAAEWYKAEKDKGLKLESIARQLGDRHDTVQRLVSGMFVLEQAENARVFDVQDRHPVKGSGFAFSHLYTALTRPGFRDYLGLSAEWRSADPELNPVPEDRIDALRNVLLWLYGSKSDDIEPVIRQQNPNLRQLDRVLQSPTARVVFMQRQDLREAYALVGSSENRFETALVAAKQNAEAALSQIGAYEQHDETLLQLSGQLFRATKIIHTTMSAIASGKAS
ncbi:MAG: hypothetical protein M1274_13695 [Actinobacteria bacterium]|nr:hypothetical protein [Actinomycetota bacterium]